MEIMKFNETWWTKGHATFGTHEEGGLLKAHAPLSNTTYYYKKNWNLQCQSHKTKKIKKKKKGNLIGVPSYNIIPNLKFTMGLDAIITSLLSSTRPKHPRVYYSPLLSHATWVPQGTYATHRIQKLN
jgi:hypothetical protein